MLTYHQVQGYLRKTTALSNDLRKLKEMMLPVLQIFETIDRRNQELNSDRDLLHGEIRSVELLGEILRQHVYKQLQTANSPGAAFGAATIGEDGLSDTMTDSEEWSTGKSDFVI